MTDPERLQKVLARSGFGSRRSAEQLIAAGRVTVDGAVATLGTRADPATQHIAVDGQPISVESAEVTLALNKPVGYVVTARDEHGRPTVYDLVRGAPSTLRYVGRLDQETEGLLLLTTDGDLAHRLTHPRWGVDKVYEATLVGAAPAESALDALRRGVMLADGRTAPASVAVVRTGERRSTVRLTIREGRNRQVRRMFEAVGARVARLVRTDFGPIQLDGLPRGEARTLDPGELAALRRAVGLD